MNKFVTTLSLMLSLVCRTASAAVPPGLHTVVIDAGHGGKDPGAVSRDGKTYEKDLALDIARRLSTIIRDSYPDIKVVMTRSTDESVSLLGRAEKANRCNADLFISLHVNAHRNTAANGCSVHVLGQSSETDLMKKNMEVCMRENSVILLESDYTTSYQGFDPSDSQSYILMSLMQNAYLEQSLQFAQIISRSLRAGTPFRSFHGVSQDPFYVLWKTSMPAVLVEMGFISNPDDLALLKKPSTRDAIARSVFEAFKSYKSQYDASLSLGSGAPRPDQPSKKPSVKPATGPESAGKPAPKAAPEPAPQAGQGKPAQKSAQQAVQQKHSAGYGIQIFAVKAVIPEGDSRLMGYKPVVIQTPGSAVRRYVICVSPTEAEARKHLPAVRKRYPDAFIVRLK